MKNYKKISYFASRPDIVKIFEDLEEFYNFCRVELRKYDPAELYKKNAPNYRAFLKSKNPTRNIRFKKAHTSKFKK